MTGTEHSQLCPLIRALQRGLSGGHFKAHQPILLWGWGLARRLSVLAKDAATLVDSRALGRLGLLSPTDSFPS